MKLIEVLNALIPLRALTEARFTSFKKSRELAILRKNVEFEVDFYAKEEKKIVDTYAEKNESGEPIILEGGRIKLDRLGRNYHMIQNKNFIMAINVIKSYKNFHYNELHDRYDDLITTLIELEKKNLNSIWLKIIGNYLKTGSLRNMDCITGNPPWVRWSNLPDTYKLLIKNNCRVDGVFSKDTNSGGVDLNIAALIAFITIRERLNENGCLGV